MLLPDVSFPPGDPSADTVRPLEADEYSTTTPVADDPAVRTLLRDGRLLPLHPSDYPRGKKIPWLRSVIHGASKDLGQIRRWQREKPGCNWGVRIDEDSYLVVLDLEAPEKGKGDGRATLATLEQAHGQALPSGPQSRSMSGGLHLWGRIPAAFQGKLKNWVQVFGSDSGIDIRVGNGLVAIPPSTNQSWIISPADVEFPEFPGWLFDEMLRHRPPHPERKSRRKARPNTKSSQSITAEPYTDKQWFLLTTNAKGFMGLWNKTTKPQNGSSHSEYELALATKALCHGFTRGQVIKLIQDWWATHPVEEERRQAAIPDEVKDYDPGRFITAIMPDAHEAARPYIEAWQARQAAEKAARTAKKTRTRVMAYVRAWPGATPTQIWKGLNAQAGLSAVALGAVTMMLKRLVQAGVLACEGGIYRGTNPPECITNHEMLVPTSPTTPSTTEPLKSAKARRCGWKPAPDVVWYAQENGIELSKQYLLSVQIELQAGLGKVANKTNFHNRLITDIEDRSGRKVATAIYRLLDRYYKRIATAGRRIRICPLTAVQILRELTGALAFAPSTDDIRQFLNRMSKRPRPLRTLKQLVGALIIDVKRRPISCPQAA